MDVRTGQLKKHWVPNNWFFWTVVLKKIVESPLDCKEIKSVNPKEINPEYSLEGLMLKLQYFSHLKWRADSLEKRQVWWTENLLLRLLLVEGSNYTIYY